MTQLFRIGEFSKMTKTTIKTLRHYDELGLLKPAFVDEENGYRYYTTDQLLPLHRIVSLRQVGLSLDAVRSVISGNDARPYLLARQAELVGELATARERLSRIQTILELQKEDYRMDYQAIIKELPQCVVYYQRGVIAGYHELTGFILGSAEKCRAANPGLKCLEPDYCFVRYLDGEHRETDIAVEYAQAVERMGTETDEIKFRRLEPCQAICVFHQGPYSDLGQAYAFACKWLEQNGYEAADFSREHYIDGMWNKEDPAQWLTEIQIPIKR